MAERLRDRYEPLETLGSGGEARVLKAWDHLHARAVALKIRPAPEGTDRERLLDEARTLYRLRPHSALPTVRDDFFHDASYVIVMDWVEGGDLAKVLAERGDPGLPAPTILGWLEQAASALDHLHGHEPPVAHGDVKPANLVLTPAGRIVLVDFGLGGRAGAGTRGFVAPEVAAGAPPSPAADVYGLAATALVLLTGTPLDGVRPDWSEVASRARGSLERALRRGLSIDPSRRPATAGELIDRLHAFVDHDLPSGIVTFLATDIEASASLWERDPSAMSRALARHDELVAGVVEDHDGFLLKARGEGDSTMSVFARPPDAVAAALRVAQTTTREAWPGGLDLRLRIGLHTGEAELREGDYFGMTPSRSARLRDLGTAGGVVLSVATAELVTDVLPAGASIVDLGPVTLRGLERTERVFGLRHPDLPAPVLPAAAGAGHNLPQELTSFVGRERELADATKLVRDHRLTTVTGTGGAGKTRLALRIASEFVGRMSGGVRFVDLTPLADGGLVAEAVASAFDIRETAERDLVESIVAHLRPDETLLVLDNCEHVLAACSSFVTRLLVECPAVRVLATSREALGVAGEVVHRIRPLDLPDTDDPPLEQLDSYDAVRLFCERAAAAEPSFRPTDANAGAVIEICRRLDGLPLAIELAAAAVRMLDPRQIAVRLDDRFRLLAGPAHGIRPRHETLRSLVDWSHDLLDAHERILLRRVAVFAGGWALEGAEEVCADDALAADDVLTRLTSLVDKSLVATERDGSVRYRLLETIREYALERLAASGEGDRVRARHLEWCTRLAGATDTASLARLEADHDNLRAALGFALGSGDAPAAARLAATLVPFWEERCHWPEGERWLASLRDAELDLADRWTKLDGLGRLRRRRGHNPVARGYHTEALAVAREIGDPVRIAASLNGLAEVAWDAGDVAALTERGTEAIELARGAGDHHNAARALSVLATGAWGSGRVEEAIDGFRDSAAEARLADDLRLELAALNGLAQSLFLADRVEEGRVMLRDVAERAAKAGETDAEGAALMSLGLSLMREDRPEAIRCYERAAESFAAAGNRQYQAKMLQRLGEFALDDDVRAAARAAIEPALEIQRRVGDFWGAVQSLHLLAEVALRDGDHDEARAFLEEALGLHPPGVNRVGTLHFLGRLERAAGNFDRAAAAHREALVRSRDAGDRSGMALSIGRLAMAVSTAGDYELGARLFGAAEGYWESEEHRPRRSPDYEAVVAEATERLGAEAFRSAWSDGKTLDLDTAARLALGEP